MRGAALLARLAVACFLVGAGLMLLLDHPAGRAAGVAALVAAIVLGTFAIASPEHLARGQDPDEER